MGSSATNLYLLLTSNRRFAHGRFELSELVGKCLEAVATANEPEYELQRDRKGAKELVNCSSMLLLKR